MTSQITVIAKSNRNTNSSMTTEYDDLSNLSVPNTAEEFLRMLLVNIQGLNRRVQSMENKLDKFMSSYEVTHTIGGEKEGLNLASNISYLAEDINQVSVGFLSPNKVQAEQPVKVKSGVIVTVGEVYVDQNLISNVTGVPVSVQPLDGEPDISTTEPEFVIIQPSSDICDRLGTPDFREIESDVKHYLDIARKLTSQHPGVNVFISSLPPRYDTGEASESTDLWNNILVTETFVHNRVHVVAQSGLECKEGKKRFQRFKSDGFLLTPYGTKLLSKNIGTSVIEVLGSMQKMNLKHKEKPSTKFPVRNFKKNKQYLVRKLINALV